MKSLTDLEAAALGCAHAHQPCTAHFVRTQFGLSPSARFSDSAGSVYPLMRRLEQRGMLSAQLRREGRRDVRYYTATAAGRRALKAWLGPPFEVGAVCTFDPLRTRMLYLELLSPRQREAWLDEVEHTLRQHLATIDEHEHSGASTDLFDELASENARLETLARLEWQKLARRRLARAGLLG